MNSYLRQPAPRTWLPVEADLSIAAATTLPHPNSNEGSIHERFIGRAPELHQFRTALAEAAGGHGRLVLVAGEPGIGKTRLTEEIATEAEHEGLQVVLGRCWEGDGAPNFWPWLQIVRTLAADREAATEIADLGVGSAAFAQISPAVQQVSPDTVPPVQESLDDGTRFRFFDSVTTILRNASARRPLVLIVDDLHWADEASLRLLQFLAGQLAGAALLVVGTYRDIDPPCGEVLRDVLRQVARHRCSHTLSLRGLSPDEVAQLIEETAGAAPSPSSSAAIHERTEGNPFFVREMVRVLLTEGETLLDQGSLPSTVREVVIRRLNHLSEPARRVLAIAAVIGREFGLEALEEVTELPRVELLSTLDDAVATGIVTSAPSGIGHYRFAHALIGETLYAELPSSHRTDIHLRIGEMLERQASEYASPTIDRLAHHFYQAAASGAVRDKAFAYARAAADHAMAVLSFGNAATLYQHALQLSAQEERLRRQRCELLLALGAAQCRTGQALKARESFLQSANLARRLSAPDLLARSAIALAESRLPPGRSERVLVELLEEALHTIAESDSPLRVQLLAILAVEIHFSPSRERQLTLSHEAVTMAYRLDDERAEYSALRAAHYTMRHEEHAEQRLVLATEMLRLAEALGDPEYTLQARLLLCRDLLGIGDLVDAKGEIDRCTKLADELRHPRHSWNAFVLQAMRSIVSGHFKDGERLAEHAFTIGQRTQTDVAAGYLMMQMYQLRLMRGQLDELAPTIEGLVDGFPGIPAARALVVHLYANSGHDAAARRLFDLLAANKFAVFQADTFQLIALGLLAEVCALVGDGDRAEILYRLLLPHARRTATAGIGGVCEGSVSRYLGMLARTLLCWDDAEQHFENALKMDSRLDSPPLVARTKLEYARMLLARRKNGDRKRARALLNEAIAMFETLEMVGFMHKALALREQHLGRAPGAPIASPTSSDTPASSTPRHQGRRSVAKPFRASVTDSIFRRDGQYWTIRYANITSNLRDSRGLQYLACLLRHPGKELHVIELGDLLSLDTDTTRPNGDHRDRGDAGPILDGKAKAAYQTRLAELRDELADAGRCNDPGRAERVNQELDAVTEQIAAAFGQRGRPRGIAASSAERARVSVRNRIAAALTVIRKHNPALWRHLSKSLKTGTFCCYDPEQPIIWEV